MLSVCSLRQRALDFDGNRDRIIRSIEESRSKGCTFRVGPELEICGYGCWDHFLEADTYSASWKSLGEIIQSGVTAGILCDIGMPIVHRSVRYNCRVLVLEGRIVLIRPKMVMADSGNYHESRWFAMWPRGRLEDHHLPAQVRLLTNQSVVPFGEAVISTNDTCIGFEICEEFFVSNAPHVSMAVAGVEIFSNGSASHYEEGKWLRKQRLIGTAMQRSGGVYLYANALGCDGDRLFYDGGGCIVANDEMLAIGGYLEPVKDVVVTTAGVDLAEVRTHRGKMQCMANQIQYVVTYNRIAIDHTISAQCKTPKISTGFTLVLSDATPALSLENATAAALWIYDYLLGSRSDGFLLPLSGGIDSSCVAILVYHLCTILKREGVPIECGQLLYTVYLACEGRSTQNSAGRAERLAKLLGATHRQYPINRAMEAIVDSLPIAAPDQAASVNSVAMQNLQGRLRMLMTYYIAQAGVLVQTETEARNRAQPPNLLVLATGNASETISGYFTKYDCSSGDINPIGSFTKEQVRQMLISLTQLHPHLVGIGEELLNTPPSAELSTDAQSDEADLKMTYKQLDLLQNLRMHKRCGPFSMLNKLQGLADGGQNSRAAVSSLVTTFYKRYAYNRHKCTSLPPTFHGSPTSPDDNRYDLRPVFYPSNWPTSLLDALSPGAFDDVEG